MGLLGIVLVILKATGYITWPWLWVLAPFWIGIVALILFVIGALIVTGAVFTVAWAIDRHQTTSQAKRLAALRQQRVRR